MFLLAISFVLKFNDITHLVKQLNYFSCICLLKAVITTERAKNDKDYIFYPVSPVAPVSLSLSVHLTKWPFLCTHSGFGDLLGCPGE